MISTFLFSPLISLSPSLPLYSPFPSCLLEFRSAWSSICLCSPLKACVMVLIPIPSFDCVFHGPALPYTHLPPPNSKIKIKRAKNQGSRFLGREKRTRSDFWTRLRLLCFTLFGRSKESFWVFLCVWISFGDGGHRVNTFYFFYILPIDGMDRCFRFCRVCWLYLLDRNTNIKCYSLNTSVHQNKHQIRRFWVIRQQEINKTLANTSLTTPDLPRKIKPHIKPISKQAVQPHS